VAAALPFSYRSLRSGFIVLSVLFPARADTGIIIVVQAAARTFIINHSHKAWYVKMPGT